MQAIPALLATILVAAASSAATVDPMPLAFGPYLNLTPKSLPNGVTEITLGTTDPHFWTGVVPASYEPSRLTVFEMEYFAPAGLDQIVLRYRTADGSMKIAKAKPLPLSETWQPWAVDLSEVNPQPAAGHPEMRFHLALRAKPGTSLQIRNLRLRTRSAEEQRSADAAAQTKATRSRDADAIQRYLGESWPATIENIHIGASAITVIGKAPAKARLIAIPPELASHLAKPDTSPASEVGGDFRISLPRVDQTTHRERAIFRWRLADESGARWISAAHSPCATGPAVGGKLERLTATHPKGLGGIDHLSGPDDEIFQLGITHATVNIVVNGLLRQSPAPGHVAWTCEGRRYFANEAHLQRLDRRISLLSERKIIVSGIILVGNHRHPDGTPHSTLTHPEAEVRGIFAMPNLTTQEAAGLYTAALRLLAERYDGSTGRPGRISNWIMHNEVDQAGTWTNMGDQPLHRYLDALHRSLRMMHHTARLFDRHSRVFLSLTHHWTQQSAGSGTYTVREMIEQFSHMAKAEGDFEWGLAYHPYPRDLRNPDTWNDKGLTEDFNTTHITPKNLAVLPQFMKQRHLLFQGRPRGILLSEQGFNTPTLSRQDQERQAAGLVYAFRKLRAMPEIEAWHLHRYQDMPAGEGGLRLGLVDENGTHKLGWEVYRHILSGSPEERLYEALADEVMHR